MGRFINSKTVDVAGNTDVTLTEAQCTNTTLVLEGELTGNINVVVPDTKRSLKVFNDTTGAYTLTVKTVAGTGIEVLQGEYSALIVDGTNVVEDASGAGGGGHMQVDISGGAGDYVLTEEEYSATDIELIGTLTGNRNVIVPTEYRAWMFHRNTTGSYTVTIKTSGGTGTTISEGATRFLRCDGTNVGRAIASSSDLPTHTHTKNQITDLALATPAGNEVFVITASGATGACTFNWDGDEFTITPGDSAATVKSAIEAATDKTVSVEGSTNIIGYSAIEAVAATSNYEASPVANLIDGDTGTGWLGSIATGSEGGTYCQIDLGSTKTVTRYYLYQSADAPNNFTPKSWTVYASTTGAFSGEQVLVDTQTNNFFGTSANFNISATSARYLRLYPIDIRSGTNYENTGLAEFRAYESTSDSSGSYTVNCIDPANTNLPDVTESTSGWSVAETDGGLGSEGLVTGIDKLNLNGLGGALTATAMGTVTGAVAIYNTDGTLAGYLPIYDSYTP